MAKILKISSLVLFFLFSLIALLSMGGQSYLRLLESMSLFMSGSDFLAECMQTPGGLIIWLSSLFNQLFSHPVIGSIVYSLLLLGMWWLTAATAGFKRQLFPAAVFVPAMMLLFTLLPGYELFTAKTPAFAWNGLFGISFSLLICLAFEKCHTTLLRLIVIFCATALYQPLGFYALFGLALCVIYAFHHRSFSWERCFGVLLLIGWPELCFYCFGSHTMKSEIYTAGLPRMNGGELDLLLPYKAALIFITAAMILLPWLQKRREKKASKEKNGLALGISSAIFVLSIISVVAFRYDDANFKTAVEMEDALDQGDYYRAIEAASALDERPTRLVNLLTHATLLHNGNAGDRLFTFPISDAPYTSPLPGNVLRNAGASTLFYHFGRVYDSYRWAMEDMVEYGKKVAYLKRMAKCALLMGEPELARRYLALLSRTGSHKDWAAKYAAYADNPALMEQDPEFKTIRPLMAYGNSLGGDGGLTETYLSRSISALEGGPAPLVELSMQFNLIMKSIDGFWPRFILYASTHPKLPRHYQEAAILFSTLEGKVDWRQFNIDPEVEARFNTFMEMARRNSSLSNEANAEAFRPLFGDTYWYYYFLVNNLKTT